MNPVLSPVIVGRDGELSRLRAAVEAAGGGRGGAVALLGGPGSGKSRLAGQVAAEAAAAGAVVLTGRAVSSAVPAPFRPLAEALQGGLRAADVIPSLGPYEAALGQVLPQWAPVPAGGEGPARSLAVLGEGVLRLLLALAVGRPLVLVLEDLHWADAETLAVLEYVADNLVGTPVLVLVTLREEDAAGVALLSALEARRRADVVRLGPLSPHDVARTAAGCLRREPEEALLRGVVERADGVPLFVEELRGVTATAGNAASAVPQSFAESVRARLDRLPGDPELALRLDLLTADAALAAHRLDDAEAAAGRAVAAADALGPALVRGEARLLLGRCQRERDLPVAERTFVAALDIAEGAALPLLRVRALAELGSVDVREARPPNRLLHAAAEARQAGLMTVAGVAMLHAVIAGYLRYDREGPLGHAAELVTLAERYRLELLAPAAGVLAACVHAAHGEQAEMERLLDEHLPGVGDDPRWRANAWGRGWGVLRLGLDDLPGAAEALHRAVETEVPALPSSDPFPSLCLLVDVVAGADDLTHPARAARPVARAPRGLLLAARAVALGREGEPAEAAATQAEALQVLDRLPWFRHVTARLVAEPALADGWGTPEVWLRETEAWAGEVGLPRLAEGCRGLLRRAGVRVPRAGTAGQVPAALRGLGVTCREADVLALVACGATNRDIAAALCLSPRTVEKHVERLLQKTGCASRTELAVRATRLAAEGGGRVRP